MEKEIFLKIKNDFQQNYFKIIKPKLDGFEEKRIKYKNLYFQKILPAIVVVAIILIVLLFIFQQPKGDLNAEIAVFFISLMLALGFYGFYDKSLEAEMKNEFMPSICQCFDNLRWEKGYNKNPFEFHEVGLVDNYNKYSFDDVFCGTYKNLEFELIEARLVKKKSSGKKKSSITVFKGVILKIQVNKEFNSHTIIRPDSVIKFPIKNLKRTELEDVLFEKKYDVYTNDEIESRVVINPVFMERLNDIQKVFSANNVSCTFLGKDMYVALHLNKDMFKICSLNKDVRETGFFVTMFQEIVSVYRLIEHLNISR